MAASLVWQHEPRPASRSLQALWVLTSVPFAAADDALGGYQLSTFIEEPASGSLSIIASTIKGIDLYFNRRVSPHPLSHPHSSMASHRALSSLRVHPLTSPAMSLCARDEHLGTVTTVVLASHKTLTQPAMSLCVPLRRPMLSLAACASALS